MLIPGIYGYRMDSEDGGAYWGRSGRYPSWDRYFASGKTLPRPDSRFFFLRYGGGGPYTGVVVIVIALWAILQSWRKERSVFSLRERKFVWFWSALALGCALVGFGRFAPFYQIFYALPFASTMRSPGKFFHVVQWCLVILCAYGLNGLSRCCLETPGAVGRGLSDQLRAWWGKAAEFDRNWVRGLVIALGASIVGWWLYASSQERLVAYLQEVDFDRATAAAIAAFSVRQVGWFILFLALATALLILLLSGFLNGRRAPLGALFLGLVLAVDLARADVPWVVTWDYERKYASNPVIDFLREKPYENRVAILPFPVPDQLAMFNQLYSIEWLQQIFQYYNVQSLDQIMNPRPREDEIAFKRAMALDGSTNTLHLITRNWALTNTRYLLGPAPFLDALNTQIDPVKKRFRLALAFDVVPKPGIKDPVGLDELTAVLNTNGIYALFEFTGALPRATLYGNWEVSTNDSAALKELSSPGFDPHSKVLVADTAVPAPKASVPAQGCGTVEFASYAPKDVVLKANAQVPAVLLLNDRYDDNWRVTVDGKPEKLLRCNYIMRGVYLQPGSHRVEFQFAPPVHTLYVSLAALAMAVLMLGYLAIGRGSQPKAPSSKS